MGIFGFVCIAPPCLIAAVFIFIDFVVVCPTADCEAT